MKTRTIRGAIRSVLSLTAPDSIRALADGSVRITGWANTVNQDRYGTIFDPGCFDSTLRIFRTNPIMLLQHDSDRPIGTWDLVESKAEGLWVSGVIRPGTQAADEAITLVKNGVLRCLSIGFRELNGQYDQNGVYHFTQVELFEVSVVSVPGNRESIFVVDENGNLKSVTLLDDELSAEDVAVRAVLRRVRATLRAAVAAEVADRAQILIALKLLDAAARRLP